MSKHWNPEDELKRARPAKDRPRLHALWREQVAGRPLPHGSRTALVLLALACVGVGIGLYELIGPRDVFERDVKGDWSAVDEAHGRQGR